MFLFEDLAQIQLVDIIEILGTIAFAISGIRLASAKRFDWFGAIVIGFVTATGGGTLRDLLLDVPPFWMQASRYIWCTLLAFIISCTLKQYHLLVRLHRTWTVRCRRIRKSDGSRISGLGMCFHGYYNRYCRRYGQRYSD